MAFNSIFISYSHRDEAWKNKLLTYFKEHPEQEEIEIWEDRQIKPGDLWYNQIHQAIDRSAIALLLISPHFLDSHFIQSEEIPKLLQQKAEVGLRIIPIIIQDCAWKGFDWIEKAQARPLDGKALSSFSEDLQNSILSQFVNETLELKKEHFQRFKQKLTAYLNTVVAEAEKTPPYFPPESKLTNIRVKVKVSPKGVLASQEEAQYREKIFQQAPSSSSIYKYRMDGMGLRSNVPFNPKRREEEGIYYWDKEISNKLQRGVIVGDPGFGKSWLLRWEALKFATKALALIEAENDWGDLVIPIRMRLSDLANKLTVENSVPEAIGLVLKEMNLMGVDGNSAGEIDAELVYFIQQRIGGKQALLLLDALDEVPVNNDLKKNLLYKLGQWVENSPNAKIWVTSRHANYQAPWGIRQNEREREVELLPFDDDQITEFIEAWFGQGTEHAERIREIIRENPQLRGLAELPLLLGFLCLLYSDERKLILSTQAGISLSQKSRSKIYEEIVVKLLYREWHHDHSEIINDQGPQEKSLILFQRQELLEELALNLFLEDKVQFSQKKLAKMLKALLPRYSDLEDNDPKLKKNDILLLIRELSQERGLFIEGGRISNTNLRYLFLHLTIQEYLCASFMGRIINEEGWDKAKLPGTNLYFKDLIDQKSWDGRWEQVLLLLASILKDPFPFLELLNNPNTDDVFKHRQALTVHCLGESWLEPTLIGDPFKFTKLETIRDQLAHQIFSTWMQHEERRTASMIPHLRNSIPVLIRINALFGKEPILNKLFKILQTHRLDRIKTASVNIIQKAKYELISSPYCIKEFLNILISGREEAKSTFYEILEETYLDLFQTSFFSPLLTQAIHDAKPEQLFLLMNILIRAGEQSKVALNTIHNLKEEYQNHPTPHLRKQISNLIEKAKPTFLSFLVSSKVYEKREEPLDVLDAMQYILDRQKAISTPPVFNSLVFEPADQEVLDLILEAIDIQGRYEINIEDEEQFMKEIEEIEIGDMKLKDILKGYFNELGQLLEDEPTRKIFYYMVAKILMKGGLGALITINKKPKMQFEHLPGLIEAMTNILKGDNPALKTIALEGILSMYEEREQYDISEEASIALNEVFEDTISTLSGLLIQETNIEVLKAMTYTYSKMISNQDALQNIIFQFQELKEDGHLEAMYDFLEDFLSKLMHRLWSEKSFIVAFCEAWLNLDPQDVTSGEELQQDLLNYPLLVDTVLEIFSTTEDNLIKADIIQVLNVQKAGGYKHQELMDCLEECLLSNDLDLQSASMQVLENVGKEIIYRPQIIQFLCKMITQTKNLKMASEAARAIRAVARLNVEESHEWEEEINQITRTLVQTYLHAKSEEVRLSTAISLFDFSEPRYRFFMKKPSKKIFSWFDNLLPQQRTYDLIPIKGLAEFNILGPNS